MSNARRPGPAVLLSIALAAFVSAVFFLVGDGPPLIAQEPSQQPPVFRGGVNFVSVDAYPRRDGTFVDGLRKEDFEVLEDGTPQAIESFELVRIEPNPLDSERRDPMSQADGDRQAADPKNRVFVVYLDLAHTTIAGGHYAQRPVIEFLSRTIGARDLFGVMTVDVPVSQLVFGRRTETIEDELFRHWTWGQADRAIMTRNSTEERLQLCADQYHARTGRAIGDLLIRLYRDEQLMVSLDNLMARLGGLRDERKNVLFVSEGWVPQGPREELTNVSVSEGRPPAIGVGPGGKMGIGGTMGEVNGDMTWCDTQIGHLGGIDFEQRFRLLLTSAAQANVAFYPLDVGGLRTVAPLGGPVDTLRTLAENTDGFAVVGTNDLVGSVRRIENDLSAFYLLGYYSTNSVANGRFRRIEVKVKQPGVRVSARRGYLAATAAMVAAANASRTNTGPSEVDTAIGRLASARPGAELFASGTATATGLEIAIEIASNVVTRDAWRAGAAVEVVATPTGGSGVTASGKIAAGARSAVVTVPMSAPMSGPWDVAVRVMGDGEQLEQRFDIATAAARWVGVPVGWRGAASPRAPLRPLVDARISRVERLRVEWPIFGAADGHVARLLDRTGKPLGQPLPFATVPPERGILAVDLPMSSLPEGDYVIELVATQGAETERRLLAFRVTR